MIDETIYLYIRKCKPANEIWNVKYVTEILTTAHKLRIAGFKPHKERIRSMALVGNSKLRNKDNWRCNKIKIFARAKNGRYFGHYFFNAKEDI